MSGKELQSQLNLISAVYGLLADMLKLFSFKTGPRKGTRGTGGDKRKDDESDE